MKNLMKMMWRERERESCRFEKGDNREIFCEMEEKG